jgi:hypothetical protein
MFTSILISLEFMKLMVSDRRPNTYKKKSFLVEFMGPPMIKSVTFNKEL